MIGERLGKWIIFKELGRGGMGRVYLAQEELTGRQAALKVLAAELAVEAGFLYRFQREIATLGTLDHPNIVRFFEAGHENGLYYYAMEYVEGQNLEEIMEAKGRLPWNEVLDVAEKLSRALRHVHDHGVVHRDLKPSNILRTADGTIKLTDFGIAKVFASTHLTATGGVVGSAEYISPEQAAGKGVGKRSDLYCLGAVLYTLLTGRPPFAGTSYIELLHKHRYNQCDRPQRLVPEIPYEVDELVCQLLEKDPDKRPRDCFVFSKQLASLRNRLERKTHLTQPGHADAPTQASNTVFENFDGPATLMSRLMRAEIAQHQHGGWVSRFFNHPLVLVALLGLCIGILVWTFWPLDEQALYEHGAQMMASARLADMEAAWSEYLEPLQRRFPDHPYRAEVERFRAKLEAGRAPLPSEAQRLYRQGVQRLQQGDVTGARQIWRNLSAVFRGVDAEREGVEQAEQALVALERELQAPERWTAVRAALTRAAQFQAEGRPNEAERIWQAVEELYRADPSAAAILREVHQARMRASKG
jgi:predicted Ser/Thr protein kinase